MDCGMKNNKQRWCAMGTLANMLYSVVHILYLLTMGVDLTSYRLRIGLFNGAAFKQTKACSIDVAITAFGVTCGALLFIQALLLEQGIEPNPGPWTLKQLFQYVGTSILGTLITLVILRIHRRQQSNNDRTNFALMCRLLIDVCAGLLREVLKAKTAPDSLAVILQRIPKKDIPKMSQNQLCPPGGFKGSYKDLDISMLYCVLRNIGTIPPHSQGWGKDPDNSDSSLSANIDRIRVQRNKGFGHLTTTCMSDNEFKKGWKVIKRCVKEIQNLKITKRDYLAEMNRLKKEAMSSEIEHRYIEKYTELYKIAEETHDVVKDIKESVDDLKTDVVSLQVHSSANAACGKNVEQGINHINQTLERHDVKLDQNTGLMEKISGQLNGALVINIDKTASPEVTAARLTEGLAAFVGISAKSVASCEPLSDFEFTFVVGKNEDSRESSLELAYKVKAGLSDGSLVFLDESRNRLNLETKSIEISILQGDEKDSPLPGDSRVMIKANCPQKLVLNTELHKQWTKTIADYLNTHPGAIRDFKIRQGCLLITFLIKDEQTCGETALDLAYKVKDGLSNGSLVFMDEKYIPFDIQLVTIAILWIPNEDYEQRTDTESIGKLEKTVVFQTDALHQAVGDGTDTLKRDSVDQNETLQEDTANGNKDSIGKIGRAVVSQTDVLHQAYGDGTGLKQTFVDQTEAQQEDIANTNKGYIQEAVVKAEEDIVAMDDKSGKLLETPSRTSVEQQECIYDFGQKVEHQKKEINRLTDQIKETTQATIDKCTEDHFVPTKVFEDAKSTLLQRKIVIIKGNSGDGKTRTACELMAWMWKGDNSAGDRHNKLPIQFYNLDNWDDTLKPNMNLCILIDDVSTDLFKEIGKKQELIKSLISGEMNGKSNCLVITLRNDVFKSMSSSSIFVEENVVDTSSKKYHIKEEKEQILDIYLPKEVKISETERSEIVESAPDIGFPQCCRLYRDVPELRKQGVKFFHKPFHFMKIALSNLENGRCAALLYLFLCGGKFKTGLDVFSEEIDKEKIQAAFEVKLLKDVKLPDLGSDVKKIEFVMESLDCLCGSLVVKDTDYESKDGDIVENEYFKFSHDSIRDTIALLYGEKTKIGFIKNCHCNSLCYITTSKNTPNKIFIDPNNKHMYSRLLRELKYKQSENYKCIASLDVWNDSQFMSGFFRWLDGERIDKDFYLKWTTKDVTGPYHFYPVRGDRYYRESDNSHSSDWSHTYFPSFLVYVAHTNNLRLLNHLLERTPKDHPQLQLLLFGAVRAGHIDMFNMIIERGINPTVRAERTQSSHYVYNINVLHEACLFERVEMVTKLATKYPSLVQDTCDHKLSTLHVVVRTGNCSWYDTVETIILGDISREDRVKRLSEMLDDWGMTVLCHSCLWCDRSSTMVLHLLHKYPELASIRDDCGCHCLHKIVVGSNKDLFIQVHSYLQNYYKDKGINYDITTIVNNLGESALDWAKEEWRDEEDV